MHKEVKVLCARIRHVRGAAAAAGTHRTRLALVAASQGSNWQSSHMAEFAFMLISAGVCRAGEPLIREARAGSWSELEHPFSLQHKENVYECLWHWLWHIKTTAYIIIPSPAKDPKLVFCHVTMIKSNFMTHSHSKTAKTDAGKQAGGRGRAGERATPLHLLVRQPSLSLADAPVYLSVYVCVLL